MGHPLFRFFLNSEDKVDGGFRGVEEELGFRGVEEELGGGVRS